MSMFHTSADSPGELRVHIHFDLALDATRSSRGSDSEHVEYCGGFAQGITARHMLAKPAEGVIDVDR